jgi:hypothetical protein
MFVPKKSLHICFSSVHGFVLNISSFAIHKFIHTDIKKFLSYGLLHITMALKGLKFHDNGIEGITILTAN